MQIEDRVSDWCQDNQGIMDLLNSNDIANTQLAIYMAYGNLSEDEFLAFLGMANWYCVFNHDRETYDSWNVVLADIPALGLIYKYADVNNELKRLFVKSVALKLGGTFNFNWDKFKTAIESNELSGFNRYEVHQLAKKIPLVTLVCHQEIISIIRKHNDWWYLFTKNRFVNNGRKTHRNTELSNALVNAIIDNKIKDVELITSVFEHLVDSHYDSKVYAYVNILESLKYSSYPKKHKKYILEGYRKVKRSYLSSLYLPSRKKKRKCWIEKPMVNKLGKNIVIKEKLY